MAPLGTASAQIGSAGAAVSDADYRACQATENAAFREAIEAITWKALSRGLNTLDYAAIVRDEWRKGELDRIIDARVDAATAKIRDESSWASLLQSLTSRERAKQLATAVAERVYRSEPVKRAIAGLATGVGEQIGQSIVITTADAAGPAQRCVRLFLGDRYGTSVASAVSSDAGAAFAVDAKSGSAGVSSGRLLLETTGGLTGAVILLVRRQLARMASRLGQRLVGSVLSRLVSVVAGGVGLALIAKDIWDFRHGMLPIIASEMKSAETKSKVQIELASAIKTQIDLQARTIARDTSERILKIWLDFQRAHAKVLELAASNDDFKAFLDVVGDKNLQKLDEIVALILPVDGPAGIEKALANGKLQRAVVDLSDAGLRIGRETRSLDTALAWAELAGPRLDTVVDYGLHTRAQPTAFTAQSLQRLLALEDRLAVVRLAGLPRDSRDALFELSDPKLKLLSRSLTEEELGALSGYIGGLNRPAQTFVLETVAAKPARMQLLADTPVRNAVLASKDQRFAVEMLLQETSIFDIDTIVRDTTAAWNGRIQPRLLWDRHPSAAIALGVATLLLLLILRSLLFSGRRRAVASNAKSE
ncbi:MAG: hypothetical protein AAF732_13660 [Pseudomonadota bacterium]